MILSANVLTSRRGRSAVTAVAKGAVLRALNKENGPVPVAKSSIGFLVQEPWGKYKAHRCGKHDGQKICEHTPEEDPIDGERYVHAIDWFIQEVIESLSLLGHQLTLGKSQVIRPGYKKVFRRFRHVFPQEKGDTSPLLCIEKLFVADCKQESHRPVDVYETEDGGRHVIGK